MAISGQITSANELIVDGIYPMIPELFFHKGSTGTQP